MMLLLQGGLVKYTEDEAVKGCVIHPGSETACFCMAALGKRLLPSCPTSQMCLASHHEKQDAELTGLWPALSSNL